MQEVCHRYWPSSQEFPDIDGESYGYHSIYTLTIKKHDGFIVRNFGITSPNVSVAMCDCVYVCVCVCVIEKLGVFA